MTMTTTTKNLSTLAIAILGIVALAAIPACKSELDDKPVAKVAGLAAPGAGERPAEAEPAADELTAARPADAKTFTLAATSTVDFVGAKVIGDHKGSIKKVGGTATIRGGKVTALSVIAHMESVESDNPKLTGHLKSPDFFDTATFPTSTFESTEVREGGEGGATHTVSGKLTLHGVTKKLTFPATISVTNAGATGKAEFKINRKDFGIVYPGMPDNLIKDEVLLTFDLSFVDQG